MEGILLSMIGFLKTAGIRILCAILIMFVGMFLARRFKALLMRTRGFEKLDPSTSSFIKNTLILALRVLVIVTALIALGIPATSFVTIMASAGVTIGLALQGSLSNLAGGIMIMFFRPYSVGDHIRAMNTEGVVKEISAFYTTILTSDNSRVVLPNGSLNNSLIVNYSAEKIRRVEIAITVPAIENPEKTTESVLDALKMHSEILLTPAPEVLLTQVKPDACDFTIRVYCESDRHDELILTLKSSVLRKMEMLK